MRPYAEKLQEILVNVSASLDASENPYAVERETKRVLLVAMTSNRGLCGPFNNNIIKLANQRLKELEGQGGGTSCASARRRLMCSVGPEHVTTLDLGESRTAVFDNLDF